MVAFARKGAVMTSFLVWEFAQGGGFVWFLVWGGNFSWNLHSNYFRAVDTSSLFPPLLLHACMTRSTISSGSTSQDTLKVKYTSGSSNSSSSRLFVLLLFVPWFNLFKLRIGRQLNNGREIREVIWQKYGILHSALLDS